MTVQRPTGSQPPAAHAMRSLRGIDPRRLREAARVAARRVVEIDLIDCRDRTAALQAIGRAFGFARWYGANLDALYDALTDLGDPSGNGYVVLLNRLPRLSSDFNKQQRLELLNVFRDAVSHYRSSGPPFSVFYRD